jgi:hypothetical protein
MYYPDRTATQVLQILATHYDFEMPDFDPLSVFYVKEQYLDIFYLKETMPPLYGKSFQYMKEYNERVAVAAVEEVPSPSTSTVEEDGKGAAKATPTTAPTVAETIAKLSEQISAAQDLIYELQGLISS